MEFIQGKGSMEYGMEHGAWKRESEDLVKLGVLASWWQNMYCGYEPAWVDGITTAS